MLRSFRVANHKSIRDQQELLLTPVYAKDRAALPITAIFGANASGKSNLLDALLFVRNAVRESYHRWSPAHPIPRQPFRLDEESRTAPSWYVIEMLIEGVRWTYGFEIDDERVLEEWLYTYPQQRRRIVFERDGNGTRFGSRVRTSRERSRALKELTRDNALFISVAAMSGMTDVLPVYSWLDEHLLFPSREKSLYELANYLRANPDRRLDVETLIKAGDFGVSGLDLQPPADDSIQTAKSRRRDAEAEVELSFRLSLRGDGTNAEAIEEYRRANADVLAALESALQPLRLAHGDGGVLFDPQDESAGTQSWLSLIPSVLTALEHGRTLVVDELDTSLHPRLLVRVLELFRDHEVNVGGGQLIFTTHDATLLGTSFGMDVLERDEVWFVDKKHEGSTELLALSDFRPRKDENTERRYLGGSYGAVPAVYSNTFVRKILDARRESSSAAS